MGWQKETVTQSKFTGRWMDAHNWTIELQWQNDVYNSRSTNRHTVQVCSCERLCLWNYTHNFSLYIHFITNQDDHFKGLTNLRHLILANNQLHSISPHAFDDFLSTLEDLDLSYNNLAQVPWDTIGRLTNVNTLNMDHNLIENVPQGVFTNLHKLAR